MAIRRMISKDIHELPIFENLEIPAKWCFDQANLYADDEGYLKQDELFYVSKCGMKEINELVDAGFLDVKNKIVKVIYWIQEIKKDRFRKSILRAYFDGLEPISLRSVANLSPQIRLDKIRLEQSSSKSVANLSPSIGQSKTKTDGMKKAKDILNKIKLKRYGK